MFPFIQVLFFCLFVCVRLCGPEASLTFPLPKKKRRLSGSECLLSPANVIAEISIVIHLA